MDLVSGGIVSTHQFTTLEGVEVVIQIKEMNDVIQKFMVQQSGKSPEEVVKELQDTEFWNGYHSK